MTDPQNHALIAALLGVPFPQVEDYYRELGYFVSEFAYAELAIQKLLWKLSGLKNPIGQAVLSGVRTKDGIGKINRLIEAKRWSPKKRDEFKYASDQLIHLTNLRNDILHHGTAMQKDGTWLSSNEPIIHHPDRAKKTPSSKDILNAARLDLFEIRIRLSLLQGRIPKNLIAQAREKYLASAWRYKPALQEKQAKQSQPKPHKQRRQQRPSPA